MLGETSVSQLTQKISLRGNFSRSHFHKCLIDNLHFQQFNLIAFFPLFQLFKSSFSTETNFEQHFFTSAQAASTTYNGLCSAQRLGRNERARKCSAGSTHCFFAQHSHRFSKNNVLRKGRKRSQREKRNFRAPPCADAIWRCF